MLRIVLTFACLGLAVIYVFDAEASPRWRIVVAAAAAASFLVPTTGVAWPVVDVLLQLFVCLFVLLRNRILVSR